MGCPRKHNISRSAFMYPPPPLVIPAPNVRPVPTRVGGGGGRSPSDSHPRPQCNLKKSFLGAFGASCFLCFLGKVTVPPHGGGITRGGGARGGRPLGSGRQLPPQLTVGWRPLGGGGGHLMGGFREGRMGGGIGGAGGGGQG